MTMKKSMLTPAMAHLMSPEDRARYAPGIHASTYQEDQNPPNKTGSLERVEQRDFANWCLSRGYGIVWHATHQKSTATKGTPDFAVVARAKTYWIEFKVPGADLSKDQKEWRETAERNGVTYWIAYSSHEAMRIIDPDCR
jgi:VRR-NUC domain